MKIFWIALLGLLLTACSQDEPPVDADDSAALESPANSDEAEVTARESPASREEEAAQMRSSELFARLPMPPDFEPEQELAINGDYPLVIDGATELSRDELLDWALDALPAAGFAVSDVGDVRVTGDQTLGLIGHGYQGSAVLTDGALAYRFERTRTPMPPPVEVVVEPRTDEESAAESEVP